MGRRSGTVSFTDVRRMLRLVGELRDLPRGSTEQRRHAMLGLCGLISAKVGVWMELAPRGERYHIERAVDVGWASDSERRAFTSYLDAQDRSLDPSHPGLRARFDTKFVVAGRNEVVTDRDWYRSEHVQDYRRLGGCDDFIYTGRTEAGGRVQGLSLHRPWGDSRFGEHERGLVDAFFRECAWLFEPATVVPDALVADLSPRQAQVLAALARGLSEKQLADELQLSQHTVHDYVKALHRRFRVQSRAELLAVCLRARAG